MSTPTPAVSTPIPTGTPNAAPLKAPANAPAPAAPLPDPKAVNLRFAQAMTSLIVMHPFYATLALRLQRVWAPWIPTMGTDGKYLLYNPQFVMDLSREELIGVLAHEVMHVAGLHPWRMQRRKLRPWNIATDAVINGIVTESGLKLPAGGVPPVLDKTPEELYNEDPNAGEGGGQGDDPGGCGGVYEPTTGDGQPLSEAEREAQMADTKVAVQQALNAAQRAGKLPAGLKRFVDEALEPRVPWREILARFLDGHAKSDYNWQRPNRRYVSQGLMMPSMWSQSYGEVAFGCDTSGSIDLEQLRTICSEVLGCLEIYAERGEDPELTVIWFDHAAYAQVVSDAADLDPKGGGGTSFRVVMDWMAEHRAGNPPKALIMVTDGYCDDFGEPPECPVLWMLTQRNERFEPPFGEVAFVFHDE